MRPEKNIALLATALFCLWFVYSATTAPVHDFANYYFGGKFMAENNLIPDIYFPYWFNRQIVATGFSPVFAGFAPNTPFLALLFYPLSFLPILTAKTIFNLISVALFMFSLKRIAEFYKIGLNYLILVPVFFLVPLRNEIMFGQVYLLLFFLLAESWLAYEKKQSAKAGIFLSFAIMLKVFPILLLLFFIFRKDFKTLIYTIGGCFFIVLATLPFCSIGTWQFYLAEVLGKASNGEIASAYVPNYQSVFMFLKQLLVYDKVENPGGLFSDPVIFQAVILAFKVKVIAIGWYITRKIESPLFVFSYWILACILISPYGSTYTFVLLLFAFFAVVKTDIPKWKKTALLLLIFLMSNFPLSFFTNSIYPVSFLRCFFLIVFYVLIFTVVYKSVNWKMLTGFALAAFLAGFILTKNQNTGSGLLLKNGPLLIHDYKLSDGNLTYKYWNENGENTRTVPMPASTISPADLNQNQIYYRGQLLVYDNSHKREPIVINGKTLLYLTDSGRGIGFYTLRKLELP